MSSLPAIAAAPVQAAASGSDRAAQGAARPAGADTFAAAFDRALGPPADSSQPAQASAGRDQPSVSQDRAPRTAFAPEQAAQADAAAPADRSKSATSAAGARFDKAGKDRFDRSLKGDEKAKGGKGGKKGPAAHSGLAAALASGKAVSTLPVLTPLARSKHSATVVTEAAKAKAMKAAATHGEHAQPAPAAQTAAAPKAPAAAATGFEKALARADDVKVAAPAPVASAPELPDDASLRLMLLPQGATMSLQTENAGLLRLRVTVVDGIADVKIRAADAANLQLQTGALRSELAAHGLRLGAYEVAPVEAAAAPHPNASASFGQADQRGRNAPGDADRDLPSSASSGSSNHRTGRATAQHAGRIDVEA